MPLTAITNKLSGLLARTYLNLWKDQINTNTSAIANKQPLDSDLTALAALSTTGVVARTAAATYTPRTLTGTTNRIVITDGDGVAGAPTFNIGTDVVTLADAQALTNKILTSPAISSPSGLVKGDVGLGNVDNTSDATKNAAAVALTNKTSLNGHTIPGGASTLVITTDLASYQAASATSTLKENVRSRGTGLTIAASNYNECLVFTLAGAASVVFPEQSTISAFLIGGKVRLINLAASTVNDVTTTTSGSATIEYLNGTNSVIAPGEAGVYMPIDGSAWVRIE